jgi:hypothetical protein
MTVKRMLPPRCGTPGKRLHDAGARMSKVDTRQHETATLEQALAQAQEDSNMWRRPFVGRMRSLREPGAELVEKPKGANLLKNKWVLKINPDQSGNIK